MFVSERLSLGDKIRLLREAQHITQTDLADRVEMDRATLAGYENNRRGIKADDLERIADALGVAAGNFYDRETWAEVQVHLMAAQALLLGEAQPVDVPEITPDLSNYIPLREQIERAPAFA